jgi:hypothetical protein
VGNNTTLTDQTRGAERGGAPEAGKLELTGWPHREEGAGKRARAVGLGLVGRNAEGEGTLGLFLFFF